MLQALHGFRDWPKWGAEGKKKGQKEEDMHSKSGIWWSAEATANAPPKLMLIVI